jgi:hypothetical protein
MDIKQVRALFALGTAAMVLTLIVMEWRSETQILNIFQDAWNNPNIAAVTTQGTPFPVPFKLPVSLPTWKQGQGLQHADSYTSACHKNLQRMDPSGKILTDVVVFIPSPIPWRKRREAVTNAFIQQHWAPCRVQFLYIIGTKHGPSLQNTLDLTSITAEAAAYSNVSNLRYVLTECGLVEQRQRDVWDYLQGL